MGILATPLVRRGWATPPSAVMTPLYRGPLFVMVHAHGGWDPTLLCDPKGRAGDNDPAPINRTYDRSEIATRGNLRFAPSSVNSMFFEKYHSRLLVINGIDLATNSHTDGLRHSWSGSLPAGVPGLAALLAGSLGPTLPMSYLSFGGYDTTGGVVARNRSGNVELLANLVRTERSPFNNRYHSEFTEGALARARRRRDERHLASSLASQRRRALEMFVDGRAGTAALRLLGDYLPDRLDSSSNPLIRQAQLAIAAHLAGLCVAVSMKLGGFDTHNDHDRSHNMRMEQLLLGVDFLMEEAARYGVADDMFVIMGSDLGRTPQYNAGSGKDHWPVTSMMLMGPGITGDRVVGGTDEQMNPLTIAPDTLMPDPQGVRITPAEIHRALRSLTGVAPVFNREFPLHQGPGLTGLLM